MTLIADVYRKLRTQKTVVRSIPEKGEFQMILRKATWQTRPNIVEICMAEPLQYLSIAVNTIDFQKVSVGGT